MLLQDKNIEINKKGKDGKNALMWADNNISPRNCGNVITRQKSRNKSTGLLEW